MSSRTLLAMMIAWSATTTLIQPQGVQRKASTGPTRLFGEVHRMLSRSGDPSVGLGDVDGDGDLDAVIGRRLHLNDGLGSFVEMPANLPVDDAEIAAVALGDVDGDEDLDVFLGNRAFNGLYLNDGTGFFSDASSNLPPQSDPTSAVALGDLDCDGDLDAFLANWFHGGGVNRIYLNDGTGVFTYAEFNLPFNVGGSLTVALGDIDCDGDLDALTGNQERSMHTVFGVQNRLYLNNGSGAFTDVTSRLPAVADATYAVVFEDVDCDEDLDALIGNGGNAGTGQQSALWLNNGSGHFSVATNQLPGDSDLTTALAFEDVDGDGDPDLLIGNDGQNRLYLNDGAGFFSDATSNLPVDSEFARSSAMGDLDADGDIDALLANSSTGGDQNRVYLNDGDGVFVDATVAPRLAAVSDRTNDLAAGDVDGDGDLDVLSATKAQNRLYLNDGMGSFEDATASIPTESEDTAAVGLADVDGDGDLDALTGSKRRSEHLYLNDGEGVFSDHSGQLPGIRNDARAVALGDVDGDGHPDALVGNMLYANDGGGTFDDASDQLPRAFPSADDFALGDVDGNGSLDIVLGGEDHGLLLNDGNGVFQDATTDLPLLTAGWVTAVALGDVEQDGDLDLVIGLNRFFTQDHIVTGPVGRDHLYLNNGGGVFTDASALLPDTTEFVRAVKLADVDGDGDLDAVVGATGKSSTGEPNRLYLNDGDGRFADCTVAHLELVTNKTQAVLAEDFDADGDSDLWFGNDGRDRVYTNLFVQLAWQGLPRVGKPLTLDLHGAAFGKWLLAGALAMGKTPHPPYGSFQLDPGTFHSVGLGALDADGRASLPLQLPPELDLVGVTLYWQACLMDRRRFTNVERTILTDS